MGRKKKSMQTTAPKPPSMREQLRWSAESMARTAMENHPKVKKMRDHITEEVSKAAHRAMRQSRMK